MRPESGQAVVLATGLTKAFGNTTVFSDVNLSVQPGEFVAIQGESGVGKSTLLNCLGGLDDWSAGELRVCGQLLGRGVDAALLRRQHIGFVFQAFHVLPHLDVFQNVGLPLILQGQSLRDPQPMDRVHSVLSAVGLAGLATRQPAQLSGGQLQRVAIARAIVHRPRLVLADEPTGNLDPATAERVMRVLADLAQGCALVLVTHAQSAAQHASRRLHLTAQGLHPA